MHMISRLLLFLIAAFAAMGAVHAQLPGAPLNVPAVLEAESASPAPGQNVTLALRFKPKPTWHGYWQNPGEAGFGMLLKWQLPKGVTAGQPRYPVPVPLVVLGQMNYVFEREYAVLVDVTVNASVARGTKLPIKLRGDWLACTNEICVPEGDDLSINLTAGNGALDQLAAFDRYRNALPVPLDRTARYTITGKAIEIAIDYPATAPVGDVYFFPLTEKLFRYSSPQSARRVGDNLIIKAQVSTGFDAPIIGLLRYADGQGLNIRAVPGAMPQGRSVDIAAPAASVEPSAPPDMHFGVIVIFAILGGLILNLMPCVFPILGLKALALARSGGDEASARRDALAYCAGVILSCVLLGGLVLILRAGGQEIGWAFQLQDPGFILFLLLVMVAVTANLAGLFEVGAINVGDSLTRKSGIAGSFWTGVLAALVATPCTGPFMATALGAALLLPAIQALLLFAGLGFGLALPFLLIAYIPKLRALLPRPGPWLGRFRTVMAVPMGLSAIALLWLLGRLTGSYGLMIGGASSMAAIAAAVFFGRSHFRAKGAVILGIALGIFGLSYILLTNIANAPTQQSVAKDRLNSMPFSPERLAQYRAERRPVFVYFTADWCVTCKVNEVAVLNTDATQRSFAKSDMRVLKGDFTKRDTVIARFLTSHGRSGVPLYLYYPSDGDVQILPQILTQEMLRNLKK
jgi:DsbC/DsbD-like thiol-disulfide interchange protein/cytochrome c biogenesis protein CcdA